MRLYRIARLNGALTIMGYYRKASVILLGGKFYILDLRCLPGSLPELYTDRAFSSIKEALNHVEWELY